VVLPFKTKRWRLPRWEPNRKNEHSTTKNHRKRIKGSLEETHGWGGARKKQKKKNFTGGRLYAKKKTTAPTNKTNPTKNPNGWDGGGGGGRAGAGVGGGGPVVKGAEDWSGRAGGGWGGRGCEGAREGE